MRVWGLLVALSLMLPTGQVRAGDAFDLAVVLRLDEVVVVMRDEGLALGADLDSDMLGGQGGAFWATRVSDLYNIKRMSDSVRMGLANGLSDAEIAETIAFYQTKLGQRILTLENSARQAMANPEIEGIARLTYAELKGTDDLRLAAVTRFITINDLVERNVAGSLSSSFDFLRGLVDGGASKLGDEQIAADVWAQEAETRIDTESWIYGFLLMAYRPLSDDELESYITFSASQTGQALNAALFVGFDDMYQDISYAIGVLVAEAANFSDL